MRSALKRTFVRTESLWLYNMARLRALRRLCRLYGSSPLSALSHKKNGDSLHSAFAFNSLYTLQNRLLDFDYNLFILFVTSLSRPSGKLNTVEFGRRLWEKQYDPQPPTSPHFKSLSCLQDHEKRRPNGRLFSWLGTRDLTPRMTESEAPKKIKNRRKHQRFSFLPRNFSHNFSVNTKQKRFFEGVKNNKK